jgi:hypothetical protein
MTTATVSTIAEGTATVGSRRPPAAAPSARGGPSTGSEAPLRLQLSHPGTRFYDKIIKKYLFTK